MTNQKRPTGLTWGQTGWNSPSVACRSARRLSRSTTASTGRSRRRSRAARLRPGDRLPSERSLCDELGVSRATVRRAIEELAGDGLVESRGRGSFVTGDALVEPPNTLMSLSELGRSRGLDGQRARARAPRCGRRRSTRRRRSGSRPAPSCSSSSACGCSTACRSRSTSTGCRCGSRRSSTELDFTAASLYEALERAGHAPARADYELEARGAEAPAAELLGLAAGAPVLFATTVAFGEDGRVVDLGQTVYRADRYRFQATLTRRVQRERESGNEESIALREPCRSSLAIAVAACGGTPGEEKPGHDERARPAASVKTSGFESLGPVTLKVDLGRGLGRAAATRSRRSRKSFEQKYPNVTVKITFRDFASWIKQAKLVAVVRTTRRTSSRGNQGYQLDGELVKAGLILPLDKYAKAYGWDKSFTPETLQQFEWTDDGKTFGEGTLWGVAQTGQSVGVFANKKKLAAAGIDPASLKTFDDFDAALAKLRGVAAGRRAGDHARQQGPVRARSTSGAASRAPTRRRRTSATGSSSRTARRSTPRATSSRSRSSRSGRTRATSAKGDAYNSRNDSRRRRSRSARARAR